ncbi:MAG: M4 family metallopeptidase [Rhodanobacter sp.]
MPLQSRRLSFAIVSSFALCAPAFAIAPRLSGPPVSAPRASLAAARALTLLDGPSAPAIKRASADALIAENVNIDTDGTEHVRFNRTFHGLPVIGGDFVAHAKDGQIKSISQTLTTVARPAVVPTLTARQAILQAGTLFGTTFNAMPKAKLVVYALGSARTNPVLAYEVTYSGIKADQTPTDMHYFVDAKTGKILNQWDTVETFKPGPDRGGSCSHAVASVGTGHSLTEGVVPVSTIKCGNQYQMKDLTRGGGYTTNMSRLTSDSGNIYVDADNVWGSGGLTNAATVAADAHYGVSVTWDYYKNTFGRLGIADDGVGALSRIHYGRQYANAFWSDACFCMTFGDGDNGVTTNPLVALDVAGHEMSHGVTARTSNLAYTGESGGLNEANSDIMGAMVEFSANNPNDPGDYQIGEKVPATNPDGTLALRWMFKPSLDGRSPDCYSSTLGDLDVHFSSGVANHFYYLLAEGDVVPALFGAGTRVNLARADLVCNGNTAIKGIGRADAEQIWYRGMTVYMTIDTNYAGARAATLSAANDLFGDTSTQYKAVAAAWDAVSVN